MALFTQAPRIACHRALSQGFAKAAPQTFLDEKGYVREAVQNLIEGVSLIDFEDDLRQGDGNEMGGKFRAAHSSSALVVNTFAPFKSRIADLRLPGGAGFSSLSFERKCPHGIAGRRSPNLDVVAVGPSGVVAVESKCLEHLTPHTAVFSREYEAQITDWRRQTSWFEEMLRLIDNPGRYRWLDAAQLVKHAFGVAHTFEGQPMTLLYLFWEPSNRGSYPAFQEHRDEISRFGERISGGGPEFVSMSYPELWEFWDTTSQPQWLRAHIRRLRTRYESVA